MSVEGAREAQDSKNRTGAPKNIYEVYVFASVDFPDC